MKNIHCSELSSQLQSLRNGIVLYVEDIQKNLAPFFEPKIEKKFPSCLPDFHNLHKAILVLAKVAETIVVNDVLDANSSKTANYLAKIRHDLLNCINIINGYLDLSIDTLQDAHAYFLLVKLLKIKAISRKILDLINEIKDSKYYRPIALQSNELSENRTEINPEVLFEEVEPAYLDFKQQIKILLIDDLENDCLVLEKYLMRLGYVNIKIARDGVEGLKLIEEYNPDLVLMDVDMPQVSGLEMLMLLRDNIINQELMILMISAYDSIENVVVCIKMGAIDFLSKPFNQELLKGRIEACIQKKWFVNKNRQYQQQINDAKTRYEMLLKSVFPAHIIQELTETSSVKPKTYENVAVLFTDVVGFTSFCETHSLDEIFATIQLYAKICEKAAMDHGLQKLKTIGDGFMAVGGMMTPSANPVVDCLRCASQIIEECMQMEMQWSVRAGIDMGTVTGGIVGHRQYLFDIWGDVVNTCARVLHCAAPNTICLTKYASAFCDEQWQTESLGWQTVKGKAQKVEIFQFRVKDGG
jgi:class 3 adenylate cyclase